MNIAILSNGSSRQKSGRPELVDSIRKLNHSVYLGGVLEEEIDPYYGKDTAEFLPIQANRNNLNPIVEIKSLLSVRKQIKNKKIDSVIIYGIKNHIAMSIGAKLGGAKKIICVVNGRGNLFSLSGLKGFLIHAISFPLLKISYLISDYVCFQNIDDKDFFLKKNIVKNREKCFVTNGSGVNMDVFRTTT